MKFPTYEELVEQVAKEALDTFEHNGKTLREWIDIISATEFGTDLVSRQAAIDEIHEDADWLASQGSDWQVERMERDKSILMSLPSIQPDDDRLERCRFEYINACKIVTYPTPDTTKKDIADAYAVVRALNPIFGEEGF